MIERAKGVFSCDICQKEFKGTKAKHVLGRHKMIHEGKKFKCEICSKSFVSVFELRAHKEIHNSERKTFKCDICGIEIVSVGYMKKHKEIHSENRKRYKCDIC